MGVYVCRAAREVSEPRGTPRLAGPEDLDALLPLVQAFAEEALPEAVRDSDRTEITTRARLHDEPELGGIWVWEAGDEIVSLSGHGGKTPNGIRIGSRLHAAGAPRPRLRDGPRPCPDLPAARRLRHVLLPVRRPRERHV